MSKRIFAWDEYLKISQTGLTFHFLGHFLNVQENASGKISILTLTKMPDNFIGWRYFLSMHYSRVQANFCLRWIFKDKLGLLFHCISSTWFPHDDDGEDATLNAEILGICVNWQIHKHNFQSNGRGNWGEQNAFGVIFLCFFPQQNKALAWR